MKMPMIYLDNAATSLPKPPQVAQAVMLAMQTHGNSSRGAHPAALNAARCIAKTRAALAGFFGCPSPDRVIFTPNATEALNLAIAGIEGHIVTSQAEHNSVLRPLHHRGNYTAVPLEPLGTVDPEKLEAAIRPDTAAIVIAHASNLTGNTVDISRIGSICRKHNLLFVLDAAQTAGLFPIRMDQVPIDALCFTGHKSLLGPQGTGGLCLSEHFEPRPLLRGGSGSKSFALEQPPHLPDRLEAGTLNSHGIAGLLAGLLYIQEKGLSSLYSDAFNLSNLFYRSIANIPGIVFYGDYSAPQRAPIVALNLPGLSSGELAGILSEEYNIATRSGIHCAPLLHQHFNTQNTGAVRFSFSHFNSRDDVEYACEALQTICKSL